MHTVQTIKRKIPENNVFPNVEVLRIYLVFEPNVCGNKPQW